MVRRTVKWLLLPVTLLSATALSAQQLLFLGYDLRGLLERGHVAPASPPVEGLAYVLDGQGAEATALPHDEVRLGYEIADLVLLVTPPTLARHRI
jgi:hypothetical protein